MPKRKNNFNANFLCESRAASFKKDERARPSDFVVDLKFKAADSRRQAADNSFDLLENYYDKLAGVDFKKYFTGIKDNARRAVKALNLKTISVSKKIEDYLKIFWKKFILVLRGAAKKAGFQILSKYKKIAASLHSVPLLVIAKEGREVSAEPVQNNINGKQETQELYNEHVFEYDNDISEKNNFIDRLAVSFSIKSLRSTLIFAAMLLLLIIPFKAFTYYKALDIENLKGKVLGVTEEAVGSLMSAGQEAGEMNFEEAQINFGQAANQFLKAENELSAVSGALFKLASVSPRKDFRLAGESKNILSAGQAASELGDNLSRAMNSLSGNNETGITIGQALANFIFYGEKAAVNAGELKIILSRIDENNIPDKYRENFVVVKEKMVFLEKSLNEFMDLAKKARIFLAAGSFKRYLIVFQNNAEMRATGGFLGSFALVDFSNGKIKNIEIPGGGSYDTEAGLKERIIAPEPLHLVNPLWHFWDANWWPDWTMSARKLMWFYERSGGPTVDGVISFTPTVLERVLEIIGPIDMTEKYGVIITAENFQETTRNIIDASNENYINSRASSTSATTQKPKAIIGDLTKKIIEELPVRLNKETLINLMKAAETSLNEKHILFYFTESELQSKIEEYGWDGKIKQTGWDYLSIVNTNIAGGKSDRKIKETISHKAEIQDDGSIINTVEIKRFHDSLKFVDASGVRNVNWMRVYVPLGSKLIEASGFESPDEIYFESPGDGWEADPDVIRTEGNARIDENSGTKIYEEAGKTVFANWSMVDPGQTAVIYLKYKLPFKLQDKEPFTLAEKLGKSLNPRQKELHTYAMLAQKQSGSFGSEINSSLTLPEGMNIIWHYPDDLSVAKNGWQVSDTLNTDKYWAVIISK